MKWPWTKKKPERFEKRRRPEKYRFKTSWAINGDLNLELQKSYSQWVGGISEYAFENWEWETIASTNISGLQQAKTEEDFQKISKILFQLKGRMLNDIIRIRQNLDPIIAKSDQDFRIDSHTAQTLEDLGV